MADINKFAIKMGVEMDAKSHPDTNLSGTQLSFEQRAQPVKEAIASGTFDPQGRNYTSYNK